MKLCHSFKRFEKTKEKGLNDSGILLMIKVEHEQNVKKYVQKSQLFLKIIKIVLDKMIL